MNRFLVILSFILIVLSGYMFYKLKERDGAENSSTVTSDTIYIQKTDTFIKEKLKPYKVEVLKYVTDTFLIDSIPIEINIPISKQFYCDTVTVDKDTAIVSSVISGYKQTYDSLSVVIKSSNEVVTNTITIKSKKYHFVIGPSCNVGWNGSNIQPSIGISIVFPLWKF